MSDQSEVERLREELEVWHGDMKAAEFAAKLDALLAAVRSEERERCANRQKSGPGNCRRCTGYGTFVDRDQLLSCRACGGTGEVASGRPSAATTPRSTDEPAAAPASTTAALRASQEGENG